MCWLTEQQISIVTKDVENEGINYSHLAFDLIDHVCCDIESHMAEGISFEQAYELVKKQFSIKGLRHIQQDTLLLIDKNYRIMKNSMKLIGVLAMALMAFGALFKIMHWPFASLMLLISFFFTTFVFFPSLLYVIYKEVNQKKQAFVYILSFIGGVFFISSILFEIMHWPFTNLLFLTGIALITYMLFPLLIFNRMKEAKKGKSIAIVGLLSLMLILTGLLFKIQHWPGAGVILIAGGTAIVFIFLPLFYVKEIRKSENIRIDFIFGIIALTYFIILTFLLSLSREKGMMTDFNYADNSFRQNSLYLQNKNNEFRKDSVNQSVIPLIEQADIVYNKIEEIKVLIFQVQFKTNMEEAVLLNKRNAMVPDVESSVNFLLPQYNPESPLIGLKTDLEHFTQLYNKINSDSSQLNLSFFNTENIKMDSDGRVKSWEEYHFENQPVAAALNTLSLWQYAIRFIENRELTKQSNSSKALI